MTDAASSFGEAEVLGQQLPGELDRAFLEVVAEREVAEHLEEGVVARGVADVVEVVVLAAGADAFLRGRARAAGPVSGPVKTFLNCTMPALMNISVGSFCGTSGDDGTTRGPSLEEVEEARRMSLTLVIASLSGSLVAA